MLRLKLWWSYRIAWAKVKRSRGAKVTEFEDFLLRVNEVASR